MQKTEPHVKIDDNDRGATSGGSFQSCEAWAHSDRCVMLNDGEGEKAKQTMIDALIHNMCRRLSLTYLPLAYCRHSVRLQVCVHPVALLGL
jgi:hypothetical protein